MIAAGAESPCCAVSRRAVPPRAGQIGRHPAGLALRPGRTSRPPCAMLLAVAASGEHVTGRTRRRSVIRQRSVAARPRLQASTRAAARHCADAIQARCARHAGETSALMRPLRRRRHAG
ncbi:MAG: hypothetical protein MZW92_40600 [Comamonadaceae bacterium]|nr:hypothetical protein [Comamonadaceae bacterium]